MSAFCPFAAWRRRRLGVGWSLAPLILLFGRDGIGAAHFGAGFFGCEHPFDVGAGGVALLFPCCDFTDEALGVVDSAIQALAAEHANLDLDHVEPTGMLWGVVEFDAAQNSPGFGGRECLVEGAGRVGRQVVLYDPDARSIGIMDIDKFAHASGVVFCRPPLGDLDLAPRPMHVDADEEIDGAVAAVFIIVTFELTRLCRYRLGAPPHQLGPAPRAAEHPPPR